MAPPASISDELQGGYERLRIAYENALNRSPDDAEECRAAYEVVEAVRLALTIVYGLVYCDGEDSYPASQTDDAYLELCRALKRFRGLSDVDVARFSTSQPDTFCGARGTSIAWAIGNAAWTHIVILKRCSLKPAYEGDSEQLWERHPEPWFDVDGFRRLRQWITSAQLGWQRDEVDLNSLTPGQLIDALLERVDELQTTQVPIAEDDIRWQRMLAIDTAIAVRVEKLPDVQLKEDCNRIGFCRIPYDYVMEGNLLRTADGYIELGPPWRQMMQVMKARCGQPKAPKREPENTLGARNSPGGGAELLKSHLREHHGWKDGSPPTVDRTSAVAKSTALQTAIGPRISAGVVSGFFMRWFEGRRNYDRLCDEDRAGELALTIKMMSGEMTPRELRQQLKEKPDVAEW